MKQNETRESRKGLVPSRTGSAGRLRGPQSESVSGEVVLVRVLSAILGVGLLFLFLRGTMSEETPQEDASNLAPRPTKVVAEQSRESTKKVKSATPKDEMPSVRAVVDYFEKKFDEAQNDVARSQICDELLAMMSYVIRGKNPVVVEGKIVSINSSNEQGLMGIKIGRVTFVATFQRDSVVWSRVARGSKVGETVVAEVLVEFERKFGAPERVKELSLTEGGRIRNPEIACTLVSIRTP